VDYSKDIQLACATYPPKVLFQNSWKKTMELVNPVSYEEWLLNGRSNILANNAQWLYKSQQPGSPWQPGACVT